VLCHCGSAVAFAVKIFLNELKLKRFAKVPNLLISLSVPTLASNKILTDSRRNEVFPFPLVTAMLDF